ncbi:MAG: hypothetical protein ACTHMT_05285, partial [Verrucomicrobiota bacterium]
MLHPFQMKTVNLTLSVLIGGLILANNFAAQPVERPLHVLYLGPVDDGSGHRGNGFGGGRTNYVYLPGQTLAPEAIYFDQLSQPTNLTPAYLKHFDAVVQVFSDKELGPEQEQMLSKFKSAGNAFIQFPERPSDAVMREAVVGKVSSKARSAWEALFAARASLQRQPGEVPNYERRPQPVQ